MSDILNKILEVKQAEVARAVAKKPYVGDACRSGGDAASRAILSVPFAPRSRQASRP